MKVAGIRDLRANSAALFRSDKPVLVTRHGKVSRVYFPLDEPDRLLADLGRHLDKLLERQGVTEKDIAEDFRAHRRRRL